jgi:Fur family transcriptional regulator, ferric uptake regulator
MNTSSQSNVPLAKTDAKSAVATATARLKAAHLRITQPRLTILAAMFRSSQPESIETIHETLGKSGCDLVTVYRCMAVFEEIGIVRRTYFHNGTALYSLRLDDAPHYHIVSKATKAVNELDPATALELNAALVAVENKLRELGYTHVSHMAEFFGTAPAASRSVASDLVRVSAPELPVIL